MIDFKDDSVFHDTQTAVGDADIEEIGDRMESEEAAEDKDIEEIGVRMESEESEDSSGAVQAQSRRGPGRKKDS